MFNPLAPELFSAAFAGFFAMMNPVANAPIFLGLTEGMSSQERRGVATRATLVAFLTVLTFSLLGQIIFDLFGITVGAFRIAGGILIFRIGFNMLQGQHSAVQHTVRAREANRLSSLPESQRSSQPDAQPTPSQTEGRFSVAISPLGIPVMAGPGTIATAIGFSAGQPAQMAITVAAFATLCLATWVCFLMAERLVRFFGTAFMAVITRLMGLILAVVGTQMFVHGVKQVELF